MAQKSRIYQERFSWPKAAIIASICGLLVTWTTIAWYTAGQLTEMPVASEITIYGISIFSIAIGVWGAIAKFRYGTKKIVTGDAVYEGANLIETFVKVSHYAIKPGLIASALSQKDREELEDAMKTRPGTNRLGQVVDVGILPRGGIDYLFYHTPERMAGDQGFIEFRGAYKFIKFESAWIFPYITEERDHSQIEPEIIARIEKKFAASWRRNQTPIETGTHLHPAMRDWLRHNPDAQGEVLQSIGYDRLSARFVEQVTARFRPLGFAEISDVRIPKKAIEDLREHLDGISKGQGPALNLDSLRALVTFGEDMVPRFPENGHTKGTELPREVQKLIGEQTSIWLKGQRELSIAMGVGHDGKEYWRSFGLSQLTENIETKMLLKEKGIQVTELERTHTRDILTRGRAKGVPRSAGPNFELVDDRPEQPAR